MKRIYKYPIKWGEPTQMRVGAKILTVDKDPEGVICAWAEVDDNGLSESRIILPIGTGHSVGTAPSIYISTVVEGEFVWHFYDFGPVKV